MTTLGPDKYWHNIQMVTVTKAAVTIPGLIQLGTKCQKTSNSSLMSHKIKVNVSRLTSFPPTTCTTTTPTMFAVAATCSKLDSNFF